MNVLLRNVHWPVIESKTSQSIEDTMQQKEVLRVSEERTLPVLLFDTQSIQHYIYEGTKLRTNIGASYLVKTVFDKILLPVLEEKFGPAEVDSTTWREVDNPDWTDQSTSVRVGYIGGGNALLLFRDDVPKEDRLSIVTSFTKRVMLEAPGLRTGAAMGVLHLDSEGHWRNTVNTDEFRELIYALKDGQNRRFPQIEPPYAGLTLSCPISGIAADAYDDTDDRFYSQGTEAKLRVDDSRDAPAERELIRQIKSVLSDDEKDSLLAGYAFPREIEHLGQYDTENYFAIVHIDGNNMGKKFIECDTLTKRKNLSRRINEASLTAFSDLLKHIKSNFAGYYDALKCDEDDAGNTYLPIRPVILGGDDMTFVCAAKAALGFTDSLMKSLLDKYGIKSCAGIAFVKTSYPFARGYEMAEELCGAAKAVMRHTDNDSCWLDFALLHGEQPPTLDALREQEYKGDCGNLHFGPYRVDAKKTTKSLDTLIEGIKGMKSLPQSRSKELRRVLARSRDEQQQFLAQMEYLHNAFENEYSELHLPDVPAWNAYEKELFVDGETPYIDAIELIAFLLDAKKDERKEEHE